MKNSEYVEAKGQVCPNCKSQSVDGGQSIEFQGSRAVAECFCNNCGAEWVDVFELTGYDNLKLDKSSQMVCDECKESGPSGDFEREGGVPRCPNCNSSEVREVSCPYCSGACELDPEYACDGYLGDIDGLVDG
jgi:hypothetical protein